MSTSSLSKEEIAKRGHEWYERELRQKLEPSHDGQSLIINIENGEYLVDPDELRADDLTNQRFGDAPSYAMRVGRRAMYRIGGGKCLNWFMVTGSINCELEGAV